ncbi:hypothetical protein BH23DEI1_BH23DEI1_05190 [soil metagenome]
MLRLLRSARLAVLIPFVLVTLASTTGVARSTPSVGVTPTSLDVGDALTLDARGLPPGSEHVVVLEAPDGSERRSVHEADADGRLTLSLTLDVPGTHRVRLAGDAVEALFVVRAVATNDRARTEPEPPVTEPELEPEAEPELEPEPEPSPPVGPDRPDADAPLRTDDLDVVLEEGGAHLVGPDGDVRWRFERPLGSGDTRAALLHLGRAWIAHGNTLFEVDVERGHVIRRTPLSGPIVALAPAGTGVRATVLVSLAGGTIEYEHRVADGVADPIATFDPFSPLFGWALREADVADPAAAIAADGTNPHLHVRVAAGAATQSERDDHIASALATATTFYDRAHVARGLVALEAWDAAEEAMAGAVEDFRARGYDPHGLIDGAIHDRYGFPLRPMRQAVERGDLEAADFWAPWLVATAAPELPNAAGTLRDYADALLAEGRRDEAAIWRAEAGRFGAVSTRTVLGETALGLGRGGWYAAVALLVATLLLHLTLVAKYWRPQSLLIRQARETGKRVGPLARWRAMRYYGTTEKVALLLMLAAAYSVAALAVWSSAGDVAVRAASAGHLEAPFVAPLFALDDGDPGRTALIDGYLAARRGQEEAARRSYEHALALGDPDSGAALDALAAGERVPAPSRLALREAVTGSWSTAVGRAFANPYRVLADGVAAPRVPAWAWPTIITLFVIVALIHVVALAVPRPRMARNAPRTAAYHTLSVLVPGSGAADELYGVLLLVPTAVFGLDALMQLLGTGSPLGIPLRTSAWILGALYVVNAVAVGIEYTSYRRRMVDLRRDQPDLARAYGLRELAPER